MCCAINGDSKGLSYSDLISIEGIVGMRAAKDEQEAAVKALKAGLDMDLGGNAFGKKFEEGIRRRLDYHGRSGQGGR